MSKQKSFTVNGSEYRPCEWADSRKAGYRWYRVTLHGKTGMEWSEQHSPKFRTKAECVEDSIDRERQRYLAAEAKKAEQEYFDSLV